MACLRFIELDSAALLLNQGFGLFDVNVNPVGAPCSASDRFLKFDALRDVLNTENILKYLDPERMAVYLFLTLRGFFPLVIKLSGRFTSLHIRHTIPSPLMRFCANYSIRTLGRQGGRTDGKSGKTLVVLHIFAGSLPEKVSLPVPDNAVRIDAVLSSEKNGVRLKDGRIEIEIRANFEAVAAALS